MRLFLGVDPGNSGGIAVVNETGVVVDFMAASESDLEIVNFLRLQYSRGEPPLRAVVEQVGATPMMGRSSAFVFGGSYRALKALLTAAAIPYELVTPGKWQQVMGVPKAATGKVGQKDKNLNKRRAQELFPDEKVTHKNADALMLAEYCRRLEVRA